MKTHILKLLVLAYFSTFTAAFSCSCLSLPLTFCSLANSDHTFLSGEVLRHYELVNPDDFPVYTFIDILVKERIHGEIIENTITILGQDGTSCGISLAKYKIGTNWLFKLTPRDPTTLNVGLKFSLYRMNPCDINTLPIENGVIVGLVAPEIERMTVADFKRNLDQCFLIVDNDDKLAGLSFKIRPNFVTTTVEVVKGITQLGVVVSPTQVRILNANGQLMGEQKVSEQEMLFLIDMSFYPQGIYFLVFCTGSDIVTKKVIKI